jgi:hypothetical protein
VAETKFVRRAKKGYNNCKFKVGRGYSATIVVEALKRMDYEVERKSKNGKAILVVKW